MLYIPNLVFPQGNDEIANLERLIIKKINDDYQKRELQNIPLTDSLCADVLFDNKPSPNTFQLVIARKEKGNKFRTVEWYVDNNLDGLRKDDSEDEYHTPYPEISDTIGSYRFNRIIKMSGEDIRRLNNQYLQRLKQVNIVLTKTK